MASGTCFCHGPGSGSGNAGTTQIVVSAQKVQMRRSLFSWAADLIKAMSLPSGDGVASPILIAWLCDRKLASPVRRADNYRFARYEGEMRSYQQTQGSQVHVIRSQPPLPPRLAGCTMALPRSAAREMPEATISRRAGCGVGQTSGY
jgi:hypothetical protein